MLCSLQAHVALRLAEELHRLLHVLLGHPVSFDIKFFIEVWEDVMPRHVNITVELVRLRTVVLACIRSQGIQWKLDEILRPLIWVVLPHDCKPGVVWELARQIWVEWLDQRPALITLLDFTSAFPHSVILAAVGLVPIEEDGWYSKLFLNKYDLHVLCSLVL